MTLVSGQTDTSTSHWIKGHFTHETESPLPLYFKHSHWWQRWSRFKSPSHYVWETNKVSISMQDGCKVYLDSYTASNGSCVMVTRTIFQKRPLGGRPHTKPPGDHGTPNAHNCRFILFHHARGSRVNRIHRNNIRSRYPVTRGFTLHSRTRDHTTWFRRCLRTAFGLFLLGSHYFSVTALGLCVKWPYVGGIFGIR